MHSYAAWPSDKLQPERVLEGTSRATADTLASVCGATSTVNTTHLHDAVIRALAAALFLKSEGAQYRHLAQATLQALGREPS